MKDVVHKEIELCIPVYTSPDFIEPVLLIQDPEYQTGSTSLTIKFNSQPFYNIAPTVVGHIVKQRSYTFVM